MKPPNPDWSVTVGGEPASLLAEVLNCHMVWDWLTKPQRVALVAEPPAGHTRVMATLRQRGLVDDAGLTEAGRMVVKWRPK